MDRCRGRCGGVLAGRPVRTAERATAAVFRDALLVVRRAARRASNDVLTGASELPQAVGTTTGRRRLCHARLGWDRHAGSRISGSLAERRTWLADRGPIRVRTVASRTPVAPVPPKQAPGSCRRAHWLQECIGRDLCEFGTRPKADRGTLGHCASVLTGNRANAPSRFRAATLRLGRVRPCRSVSRGLFSALCIRRTAFGPGYVERPAIRD
jgi:hypothetical protein